MSHSQDPLDQFQKLLDGLNTTGLELLAYVKRPMETFTAKLSWAYFKLPLRYTAAWLSAFGASVSGQTTISQVQLGTSREPC